MYLRLGMQVLVIHVTEEIKKKIRLRIVNHSSIYQKRLIGNVYVVVTHRQVTSTQVNLSITQ